MVKFSINILIKNKTLTGFFKLVFFALKVIHKSQTYELCHHICVPSDTVQLFSLLPVGNLLKKYCRTNTI